MLTISANSLKNNGRCIRIRGRDCKEYRFSAKTHVMLCVLKITASLKLFFLAPKIYEPRSDKRDLLTIKVKVRYEQRKKDLAVVNNYRKFKEIVFTNNKVMSV